MQNYAVNWQETESASRETEVKHRATAYYAHTPRKHEESEFGTHGCLEFCGPKAAKEEVCTVVT